MRKFDSEEQKRTHVIKLNLCRRQMTDHYWGKMFKQLCLAKGVRLGQGKRNDKKTSVTMTEVASELGVSESTARRRVRASDDLEIYGDAIRDAGKRPVSVKTAHWHGKM